MSGIDSSTMNMWKLWVCMLLLLLCLEDITHKGMANGAARESFSIIGEDVVSNGNPHFPYASTMDIRQHPIQPDENLWDVSKKPLPTNVWWDNLVLGGGSNTIAPLPYLLQAENQGMRICYPGFITEENYVLSTFLPNILINVKEKINRRKVVEHDDFSVAMEWQSEGGSMTARIVQGCPYVTFEVNNLTPIVGTIHALLTPNHSVMTGRKFKIDMNNGQTWLVYTSTPLTLAFGSPDDIAEAANAYKGVIRIAVSPTDEAEDVLDDNHFVYPIGGKVDLAYDGGKGIIQHDYATSAWGDGSGDLLMMALPHHIDAGVSGEKVLEGTFRSIKGPMTGILGTKWTISLELSTISWTAKNAIDKDRVEAIRQALLGDQNLYAAAQDPYFFGKEVAAMARLLLIANEIEEHSISDRIQSQIKEYLEEWFSSKNSDPLVYDDTWGGIVSKNSMLNIHADFGNAAYNDHHYHYGYLVYAAAVIGKQDPSWLESHLPAVTALVRDYANPSHQDPHFVFCRHKDMYAWHSWAGGVFSAADSKNQESTSEAVNGYYAVYLLGLALENDRLANFGRILTHMEIKSAQKYWQVTDTRVYSEPYASRKVVGVLWSTKVDHTTWFGANLEYIHGIQYLPVTPISEELLTKEWILESYPVISQAIYRTDPPIGDEWLGYIYMIHAIINPHAAWLEIQTLQSYLGGNTKTNALYWAATRPDLGYPAPPAAISVQSSGDDMEDSTPDASQDEQKPKSGAAGGCKHMFGLTISLLFVNFLLGL